MSNKLIGKLYEKRGDDRFDVVVDPTGDVVGITQFENGGLRSSSIDLFVESIPALVGLLQKAAGIESAEPEYEYSIAMRRTDIENDWHVSLSWKADLDRERRGMEAMQRVCMEENVEMEYKLVKRRKPVVEDV